MINYARALDVVTTTVAKRVYDHVGITTNIAIPVSIAVQGGKPGEIKTPVTRLCCHIVSCFTIKTESMVNFRAFHDLDVFFFFCYTSDNRKTGSRWGGGKQKASSSSPANIGRRRGALKKLRERKNVKKIFFQIERKKRRFACLPYVFAGAASQHDTMAAATTTIRMVTTARAATRTTVTAASERVFMSGAADGLRLRAGWSRTFPRRA